MGKIISMGIQKGGAGKTTTIGMLANILANRGYKVLAVDFDSQGNLTQFISQRSPYDFQHRTSLEACKEKDPRPYIVKVRDNLFLLPAEDFLSKFSQYLFTEYPKILQAQGRATRKDKYLLSLVLKETLDVVKDDYDLILVDLPPNLGEQTINGMAASDFCVVVLQAEPFCKSALDRYLETLEAVINNVNKDTRLIGILPTVIDPRFTLGRMVLEATKEEYEYLVFNTVIKRITRIAEYTFTGYKADTKKDKEAQIQYEELADELLDRIGVGRVLETALGKAGI